MTEFEKYLKYTYMPYVEKIRKYLIEKKDSMTSEEQYSFLTDLQSEAPYFEGNKADLTEKEWDYGRFLLKIDDIGEELEPFEDYTKYNERLLELMKKYKFM